MTRLADSLAGTLAGLLIGVRLCAAIAPGAWEVAASRPGLVPIPAASPPLQNDGRIAVPSPEAPARTEGPEPVPSASPVPGRTIATPVTARGPVASREPETATSLSGTASTYGPGWDGWLALPQGPGVHVRICGAGGCVLRTSTDAGPSLAMQRQGRIADLDVATFEAVCGVPWTAGLCSVTVTPIPRPPVTSTRETP
jgi:hypothetical protein